MNAKVFSENLRRLRQENKYTQEAVAEKLGVSPQSVSRWECGSTMPDVLLLPEIARLYCVTVDDLFRPRPRAYENYARRLLAVFETTGKTEDFVAAETEFMRLVNSGEATPTDRLMQGVVYQKMMWLSRRQAGRIYDSVIADPETDEPTRRRAVRQRIYFLGNTGRGQRVIDEQLEKIKTKGETAEDVLGLIMAYHHSRRAEEALPWLEKAMKLWPEEAKFFAYAGNACEQLGQPERAIEYWQKAYDMDKGLVDVLYSMAFCYEDMSRPDKAREVWMHMSREKSRLGFDVEAELAMEKVAALK